MSSEIKDLKLLKQKIKSSCSSGAPTLLVFMTGPESKVEASLEDNELYADWSYHLNNNAIKISKNIAILKTSVELGRELLNSENTPDSIYSLILVSCNKKSLYAKKPIVEGYVYKYMALYLENKEKHLTFNKLLGYDEQTKSEEINSPDRLGLTEIEVYIK